MIPLDKAHKIAGKIVAELRQFCTRIEIAGSIRRGKAQVGDIDLVIQARDRVGLAERVCQKCKLQTNGQQNLVAIMPGDIKLDLWFSKGAAKSGQAELLAVDGERDNFGSLLLCRTGSVQHNVAVADRAIRLGMRWNPHLGLFRDGRWVAGETEAQIYTALGVPFLEPADRDLSRPGDIHRFVHQAPAQPW